MTKSRRRQRQERYFKLSSAIAELDTAHIHCDAHFYNILTDGEQTYLTDFGLVLDKSFMLAENEILLFKQNSYYDYGEILWSLGYLVVSWYHVLPESDKRNLQAKYGLHDDIEPDQLFLALINNIEEIFTHRLMQLDEAYVVDVIKYRDIMLLIGDFFCSMHTNNQKNTRLDHAKLRRMLKATQFAA